MGPVSGSCYTLAAFLLLQGCYWTLFSHKTSKNYNICGIFLPTVTAGTLIGVLMEESEFRGGTIDSPCSSCSLAALQLLGEHCLMSTSSFHAAIPGYSSLSCWSFPTLEHGGACAPIPSMFISFLQVKSCLLSQKIKLLILPWIPPLPRTLEYLLSSIAFPFLFNSGWSTAAWDTTLKKCDI